MSEQQLPEELKAKQETLAKVSFGIDIEAFLQSKIGRYLIQRAEADLNQALQGLKEVNPFDNEAIRLLQNTAWRAESVQQWLADAIQDGWNAEKILTDHDD